MFNKMARKISHIAGHPASFVTAVMVVLVWGSAGPWMGYSDKWQLLINTSTTIVTCLMTFLIQSSQNTDTAAIQKKLDELIHSVDKADDKVAGIENAPTS
jgi:low affinity Fe/Cu permease